MKYRMVFVAVGAAIGMSYLALGIGLLRWLECHLYVIQVWSGLAVIGAAVNVGAALAWSDDEAYPESTRRLLLLQSYLPLAVAAAALAALCTPWVLLAAWLVQLTTVTPFRLARACVVRRRIRNRMQAAGRRVAWHTLEPLLMQGAGVLILDATECEPGLVWWTDDDALADPGLLIVTDERLTRVTHDQVDKGVERLLSLSQFVARHLDAETGRALLTPLSVGFVESKKFLRMFPRVAIFAVDRQQGRTPLWTRVGRRAP